jgi:CubicO group peptidase (beta-lactamase class C family)
MRTLVATLLLLLAGAFTAGHFVTSPSTEVATAAEAPAKLATADEVASAIRLLEAWIDSQIAYRGLPGLSIAIVHDQDILWAKGFGHADVEKKTAASPQTIYRIASISKLFTSTAVLQLRDQGKLKLDDPVAKYLSWFKLKNQSADSPITIRQLLTHTAGLPRESAFPYWTDSKFPTREQMIEALAHQEIVYPPETKWKYSNLGLAVAGEVVAAVSGETYDQYITRHILTPLGMKSTSVILGETDRPRLAVGYGRRMPNGTRAIRPFMDIGGIIPAGNLSSTVEDMARFVSLQFRDGPSVGSQVLKGSTLREMHRVQWLMPDWKSGRGLGFHIVHREDGDLVGHGGWLAGYQSAVYFRPKDRIGVIAMINADDGLPYPGAPDSVVDRAFKWVAPAIVKALPPAPPAQARPEWQKYVGKYRSPWGDADVLIVNGQLVLINPTEADPTTSMATLVPVAQHTFRIEDGSPSGPHGERVVFELGKDNKVARLKIGENYSTPVP